MAIAGLFTSVGISKCIDAQNNQGFKIHPLSFGVSRDYSLFSNALVAPNAGQWFTDTISARVVVDLNTVKVVCTVPPGSSLLADNIKEVYLYAKDSLNVDFLLAFGQSSEIIRYDPTGTITLELQLSLADVDLSSIFVFNNTKATELAEHIIDVNAHPEISETLSKHGIFLPLGAYPFERTGQQTEFPVNFDGTKATFTHDSVIWTATYNGTELNTETIIFNGARTNDVVRADFNALNYPNTVEHNGSGVGISAASTKTLAGGTYIVQDKDIVYKDVDGTYKRALADGTIKSRVAGIARIVTKSVLTRGVVDINTGFAISAPVYLSGSAPGALVSFDTNINLGLCLGNFVLFTGFGGDITANVTQDFDAVVSDVPGLGQYARTQDAINVVPTDGRILINKLELVKETIDTLSKNLSIVVGGSNKGWKKFAGVSTQFKINFAAVPTQGSWRIEWESQETTDLAFNASAGTIQTAFNLFSGHNGVTITGNYTIGFTVAFNDLDTYTLPTFNFTGLNEVQRFNFSNIPDNGTITFQKDASNTLNFPWDDDASDLKIALEALPTISNIAVTGSFGAGFFQIEFQGGWLQDGLKDQSLISVFQTALSLGASVTNVNGTTIIPINALVIQQGKAKASNLFNGTTPIAISTLFLQEGLPVGEQRLMNVTSSKLSISGMGKIEDFEEGIVLGNTSTKIVFSGYFVNTNKKILTNSKLAGVDYLIEVPEFARDVISQFKISEHPTLKKRIIISSGKQFLPNGITLNNQVQNSLVDFAGAQIDFSTGVIYEADGVTSLGSSFTPAVITADQFRWVSINLFPLSTNADKSIKLGLNVVYATVDGSTPTLAEKATFGDIPIGCICIKGALGKKEKTKIRTVKDTNDSLKGKTLKVYHPSESVAFWFSDPSLDNFTTTHTTAVVGTNADTLNTTDKKIVAFKMVIGSTKIVDHVALYLKKQGLPTGTMSVRILNNNSGQPDTASVVVNGVGTINLTSIPANFSSYVLFPMASQQTLVAGTYWVELDASGYTYSAGNFLDFNSQASAAGEIFNRSGAPWLTDYGNRQGHALFIDKIKGYPALALTTTREVEITSLVTNDFHTVVATKLNTFIDADVRFVSTVATNVVEVENTTLGNVSHIDVGDTGFFTTLIVDGTDTDVTGLEDITNDFVQQLSGGIGGSGAYTVYGTIALPVVVVPATGVVSTRAQRQMHIIKSNGGAVNISANPKINAGSKIGQELLLVGGSDTDFILLTDGNGVKLNGTKKLKLNQTVLLVWDGTNWVNGDQADAAGSSGGVDLLDLDYKAIIIDDFKDISDANGTIDISANKTNATIFDGTNGLYKLSYDASKTITGTGLNMVLSSAPSFTIKKGDVLIIGEEVKEIDIVTSQLIFSILSAFTTNPTALACTVSQAVHTKDLNDVNDGGSGLKFSQIFSTTIDKLLVMYADTLTLNDSIPDLGVRNIGYSVASVASTWLNKRTQSQINDTQYSVSPLTNTSSIFVLFFANKTSGTGTVNLLDMTVAFHRRESSVLIPTQSVAYTRNSFSQNCVHTLFGGKSRLALNFAIPMGDNAKPNGQPVVVHIDGKKIPLRVVGLTDDTQAYFTFINASLIELDIDYTNSGLEIMVEVVQSIVDQSTTNTGRILELENYHKEIKDLDRVVEVMMAVPYTNIVNRAQVRNPKLDLGTKFGLNRFQFTSIFNISNELGPVGQEVFGVMGDQVNDVRFVGQWSSDIVDLHLNNGPEYPAVSNAGVGYIEIFFYGKGLVLLLPNLIASGGNNNTDLRVSIDGGSEGADVTPTAVFSENRNYRQNIPLVVASGLAMDFHTVRIRKATTGTATEFGVLGYTVIGPNTMQVDQGTYFSNGKVYTLNSLATLNFKTIFETGAIGTKGGRVLVYLKPDGTIGKAITPTDVNVLSFTSTDHANEEIVDELYYNSFASGRTDDLASELGAVSNKHFTKSDGLTAMYGLNLEVYHLNTSTSSESYGVATGASTQPVHFTFKGTGFDLKIVDNTTNASHDTLNKRVHIYVDDVLLGQTQNTSLQIGGIRIEKIVSGLKYGTHTVRMVPLTTQITWSWVFISALIYAPKKPSIASNFLALDEYCILGDFLANTTEGAMKISEGVLRRHSSRDFLYAQGTTGSVDWLINMTSALRCNGAYIETDRLNAYLETLFHGVGFDFRFGNIASAMTLTFTVNNLALNVTNFPSLASSIYATNGSFNTSTGVLTFSAGSSGESKGLVITGLPLDSYKIRVQSNTASALWQFEALDVISSIDFTSYSKIINQNEAALGNRPINQLRKFTNDYKVIRRFYEARGSSGTWSTTVTAPIQVKEMNIMVESEGEWFDIQFKGRVSWSASAAFGIYVNNKRVHYLDGGNAANTEQSLSLFKEVFLSKGKHLIEVKSSVGSGTLIFYTSSRMLTAKNRI